MAQVLYTNQYFTTTLNVGGGITDSQTTGIIIADVSGIDTTKPGIALINYADPLNTTIAEWIEYTSINGSKEFVGVTRGAEGFSAKSHDNGVSVAFPLSESHINRIADRLTGVDATLANDSSGNEIIKTASVASAVNEVTFTNSATGVGPTVSATGGDTNIDLKLIGKGSGGAFLPKTLGTITTDSDGATITMDMSVSRHQVTLGGNRTIALTNLSSGQVAIVDLIQDSTGSRTVTWPSFGATATMTIATPCVVTTGKDLPTLTPIIFTTTGALPTGVSASTVYYYVRVNATTGNIATSVANAQAGTLIASSGSQSGTHTCAVQIRWPSQTAPTLSTGKYTKDRINFYCLDATNTVVEGQVAGSF